MTSHHDSSSPTTDELVQSIVTLSNILDHVISQVDTLRGEVKTLTRILNQRKVVLGDGTVFYIDAKE